MSRPRLLVVLPAAAVEPEITPFTYPDSPAPAMAACDMTPAAEPGLCKTREARFQQAARLHP